MATDFSISIEAPPEPSYRELASIAEQRAAIDELIALARQRIRVFDHDLSQTGWNSPQRTARLSAFLRGMRGRSRLPIGSMKSGRLESPASTPPFSGSEFIGSALDRLCGAHFTSVVPMRKVRGRCL